MPIEVESRSTLSRGRLCRVAIDLRRLDELSLHALRLRLSGDIVRRYEEAFHERRVIVGVAVRAGVGAGAKNETPRPLFTADELGIRPVDVHLRSADDADATLGGAFDYLVRPPYVTPATVRADGPRVIGVDAVTARLATPGVDKALADISPAALRLALLRLVPARVGVLSSARLRRAEETVQRWRYKVAMWADMPVAPPIHSTVAAARDALAAGLDTATVLTNLHRLELDPTVPSGSKFETFRCLDFVLGLDLTHLVGKLRR
jgi:hypothetical protein